jgi:uncharacterized membrane protein YozB (DUF420 family)
MVNLNPHEAQLWWRNLPVVDATLNGVSAILLIAAFIMIKRRQVRIHAALMISAFVTSSVFLGCYLLHQYEKVRHHEILTRFPPGPWHPWYIGLLISHTILAVAILPLIFTTFYFAWRRKWKQHHQMGSITFPLWTYVSVTGVIVYWMLYHLAPTLRG